MAALLVAALTAGVSASLESCHAAPVTLGIACFLEPAKPASFALGAGDQPTPLMFALLQNTTAAANWTLDVLVSNTNGTVVASPTTTDGAVLFDEDFDADYTASITSPHGGLFVVLAAPGNVPAPLVVDATFVAEVRRTSTVVIDLPFAVHPDGTSDPFIFHNNVSTPSPNITLDIRNATSAELGSFEVRDNQSSVIAAGASTELTVVGNSKTCRFLEIKGTSRVCNDDYSCDTEGCCDGRGGVKLCPQQTDMCVANKTQSPPALFHCAEHCTELGATPRLCLFRARAVLRLSASTPAPTGAPSDDDDDGGMCGGGVFLLLFFIPCGLYCFGGCALNYFRDTGRKNWPEVLPHHTFWTELPGLVRDGIFFVQRCICGSQEARTGRVEGGAGGYAPADRTSIGQSSGAYGTKEDPEGAPGGTTL